jgi:tetratricopeptide (TPR) repeat protein
VLDYGTGLVTDPMTVAPQALVVLPLMIAMVAALRWRPKPGFLMFWVFAILAPSSSVIPLVSQTMAEHRMYLPLAAIVSLAVVAGYRLAGIRILGIGVLSAIALCMATIARNWTMQDELVLWTETIAKVPDNARAHGSLGLAFSARGRPYEAVPHFLRALELDPQSVATQQNLGNAYFRLRDFSAASLHYRLAVTLDPKFASGHNNLGAALWELGEADDALHAYRAALALDPNHLGAHQNVGRALFAMNRFAEASAHYEHILRARPTSPDAHYDLGLALARAGSIDRAAHHFGEALRLRPSAGSYLNYARFLAKAGRTADAIASLESALRLQPDLSEARGELDRLRAKP